MSFFDEVRLRQFVGPIFLLVVASPLAYALFSIRRATFLTATDRDYLIALLALTLVAAAIPIILYRRSISVWARRHAAVLTVAFVVIGATARFTWAATADTRPFSDFRAYLSISSDISAGRYLIHDSKPTGYPIFLSLLDLFPLSGETLDRLANAALGVGTIIIVILIARRLYGPLAALLSAGLLALLPSDVLMASVLASEPLFIFLATLAVYAVVRNLTGGSLIWLPLASLLLVLSHFVRSGGVGYMVFLLIPLLLAQGSSRHRWLRAALFAGAFLLFLSPLIGRNLLVRGEFSPDPSVNTSIVLANGLSIESQGRFDRNIGKQFQQRVYELQGQGRSRPRALAIAASETRSRALDRLLSYPPQTILELGLAKVRRMWADDTHGVSWSLDYPDSDHPDTTLRRLAVVSQYGYALLLVASLFGLVRWAGRWDVATLIPVSLVAVTVLAHLALEVQPRFHMPVVPMLALIAGRSLVRDPRI